MKTIFLSTLVILGCAQYSQAQSTTGGQSGGSTASTGTGYLTPGKRVPTSKASSMTIADGGASHSYMYVPPSQLAREKKAREKKKRAERAASPDGMDSTTRNRSNGTMPKKQKPNQ